MQGKTIIGSSITVDGEVEADEGVLVHGTVRGSVRSGEDVVVDKAGAVEADVDADTVQVSGKVNGNVGAKSKVELTADGRMVGDIRSPRILIADGAQYKGSIDMG